VKKLTVWTKIMLVLGASLLCLASINAVAQEPKYGGDFVVAISGGIDEPTVMDAQIDPYFSAWLSSSFFADNLAFRDYDGVIKPHLATGWDATEDGLTWTLYLREDVKFHDGTPFNAEAVKANFDRVLDPERPTPITTTKLGPIASVEVVGEYTIKVHYERPWASFLNTLSLGCFPIWSPTALEKYGYAKFPEHLVGTGPFILTEWVPGSHFTGVKNPEYNSAPPCTGHEGPVYVDSITFNWIAEEAIHGMVLKTGEADLSMELPAAYADTYAKDPNFTLFTQGAPGTGMMSVFNVRSPMLNDIRVRRAILYTIDQEEINNIAYGGKLMASDGVINPITPGYNPMATTTIMYPHDPERARQLLEDAGWKVNPNTGIREKDGVSLKLRWSCLHHEEMGEVAREQLKKIGIDLTINLVPGPIQLDMTSTGDFEIMYERMRGPDIEYLDMLYNSKNDPLICPGGWGWSGYKNEVLDRLLNLTAVTFDQEKRFDQFEAAQVIIMDRAVVLPVLVQTMYWAYANYVENFRVHADGLGFDVYDVWLDK